MFELIVTVGIVYIAITVATRVATKRRQEHYNRVLDEMVQYKKDHGWYEHEEL